MPNGELNLIFPSVFSIRFLLLKVWVLSTKTDLADSNKVVVEDVYRILSRGGPGVVTLGQWSFCFLALYRFALLISINHFSLNYLIVYFYRVEGRGCTQKLLQKTSLPSTEYATGLPKFNLNKILSEFNMSRGTAL